MRKKNLRMGFWALWVCLFFGSGNALSAQGGGLIPMPRQMEAKEGPVAITDRITFHLEGPDTTRVPAALDRFFVRLRDRTGIPVEPEASVNAILNLRFYRRAPLRLHADESYSLRVEEGKIWLEADTDLGILRGLQTLTQLIEKDGGAWRAPAVHIQDSPVYPWRGLLIDVCRHWQPKEVILRNLDAMEAVKLNVLHLHLSEDQGFRIESKVYPRLHELGSNGNYFTQIDIREIIDYAAARGIRVIPEFDMPGHATSWFPGYPQLASAPGPYRIETGFGVFDPTLDPTKESTYEFLDRFLTEMAGIFPDPYFHIGGDENNGKQWNANADIQAFMRQKGLKDNHALQAYFNRRVNEILKENGKIMVGWDEILSPDLPQNIVIQSWRGREALIQAAQQGYDVMLSNGYYIDLCQPAIRHYRNAVLTPDHGLDKTAQEHVLGGEATMWAELVTPQSVDSRIWPRTGAIAEQLWTAPSTADSAGLYPRLDALSAQLDGLGLTVASHTDSMLIRLFGSARQPALLPFLGAVEPLEGYARHHQGVKYHTGLPLTRLPDVVPPESGAAREFNMMARAFAADGFSYRAELNKYLNAWIGKAGAFAAFCKKNEAQAKDWAPLGERLKALSLLGMEAMRFVTAGEAAHPGWKEKTDAALELAKKPIEEAEIVVLPGFRALFEAALAN